MTMRPKLERGAVLVMMTLFWLVLAGIAALVVDLGLVRQRRAHAQVAVDSGVLAALLDLGTGATSSAGQTAITYVVNNGFEASEVEVHLPPTSGRRAGNSRCIEVLVHDEFASLFSSVLGVSQLDASARAVGCASSSSSGVPALFAAAPACNEKNLKLSASTATILGDVHSNDSIELSGSENTFHDGVAWSLVSYFDDSGADNTFDEPPGPEPHLDWPIVYHIADFMPGGLEASVAQSAGDYYNAGHDDMDMGWLIDNGAYDADAHVLQPGLYYTSAKIDLADSDITIAGGGGVTLVSSNGEINLNGSDHTLRPYVDDLLIFADYQKESPLSSLANCDSSAVSISGSSSGWEGIVYVPRGQVKLNGSLNTTLTGAVLAHTIELSGQDLYIDATDLGSPSVAEAKLVE